MDKKRFFAITACSDALRDEKKEEVEALAALLRNHGEDVLFSRYIYSDTPFSGTAWQKAEALNDFFRRSDVTDIFDVSGGDLANEVIPYLDFEAIARSSARFWGYSDLSTVINAIYSQTGKSSVLGQARIFAKHNAEKLADAVENRNEVLFQSPVRMLRGETLSGMIVGGNIRCFLKLAGTKYFPDLNGKTLLLESFGGSAARTVTYLEQLKMMGAFEKAEGVLLGTFTELDRTVGRETALKIILERIPDRPVGASDFIGHGSDSLAVVIGSEITGLISH